MREVHKVKENSLIGRRLVNATGHSDKLLVRHVSKLVQAHSKQDVAFPEQQIVPLYRKTVGLEDISAIRLVFSTDVLFVEDFLEFWELYSR